jgi:hypothetical protein
LPGTNVPLRSEIDSRRRFLRAHGVFTPIGQRLRVFELAGKKPPWGELYPYVLDPDGNGNQIDRYADVYVASSSSS